MSTAHLTIQETALAIQSGQLSARDAVQSALDRADQLNPDLNALLESFPDRALAQADQIDIAHAAGEPLPPLAGVPVVIKDNICLEGAKATCASKILENYRSPYTATALARLIAAGAIPIARANMDEFAMGSSGVHSAFSPTKNPWDPDRVPGGSSSGSAAAVAARIAPGALGSDTGGSIRQPAALTGLVGFKPTYSTVSRYGLVAFASSLDQIGPLTHTVEDAALLFHAISGHDPLDSTSSPHPITNPTTNLHHPIDNLRIALPTAAREHDNHPAVTQALNKTIDALQSLGAEIIEVDLSIIDSAIPAYYLIAPAEASSNLARFDGIRYGRRAQMNPPDDLFDLYANSRAQGFGPEVQRRIMLGTYCLSAGYYDAYYLRALKVRRLVKQAFDELFAPHEPSLAFHAVLTPTAPRPAWPIAEKASDPLAEYLEDYYTVAANLAGLPAISLPIDCCEETSHHPLPVGMQLVAPAFQDAQLLRIAQSLSLACPPPTHKPAICAD